MDKASLTTCLAAARDTYRAENFDVSVDPIISERALALVSSSRSRCPTGASLATKAGLNFLVSRLVLLGLPQAPTNLLITRF
jgi:hypothetical protein